MRTDRIPSKGADGSGAGSVRTRKRFWSTLRACLARNHSIFSWRKPSSQSRNTFHEHQATQGSILSRNSFPARLRLRRRILPRGNPFRNRKRGPKHLALSDRRATGRNTRHAARGPWLAYRFSSVAKLRRRGGLRS